MTQCGKVYYKPKKGEGNNVNTHFTKGIHILMLESQEHGEKGVNNHNQLFSHIIVHISPQLAPCIPHHNQRPNATLLKS